MQLVDVGANADYQREFIVFPVRLYQNDPKWTQPLDNDVADVFDPEKNKFFRNGECTRWLLLNDAGETIGRVAAFINRKTATVGNDQPTGGMGFFECIDNQQAANTLFDACKNWLAERGMEAMDGPINFGERDRWWGALAEGFDREANYGMPYTKPYYIQLFERYGFLEYYQQHTYYLPLEEKEVQKVIHPTIFERANRILNDPTFTFVPIDKKNLPKYAEDFRIIYNQAWSNNLNTGEMTTERSLALMQRMKPILDEDLMWFGYHGPEKQPVAFFIMLPELTQYFKYMNGKLDFIGKLKFLYHKIMRTNKHAFGVIFGVIPSFQGRGVESAIAIAFSKVAWSTKDFQYKHLELNWIGDFNPKMQRYAKLLGGVIAKRHITFRYLFDRTKPFKRHPNI